MTRLNPRPWRRTAPVAIGHRGQRATFPEQTLEAYQAAIALGADGIEVDVQMTRDGKLAMVHDLTVDRTTDGTGPVAAADWATLRRLDAGSWFDPRFAGCRIPSLDETIDLAMGAGRILCVEIKGHPAAAARTAAAVAQHIRSRGLDDVVFVSSFDHAALAIAAQESDRSLLAPERLPESGPPDPDAAVRQAAALGATVLQHRWEDLTVGVVDALHRAGTGVWAWPIDSIESAEQSLAVGADGLIGDDVRLLLAALGRSGPPSSADAGR